MITVRLSECRPTAREPHRERPGIDQTFSPCRNFESAARRSFPVSKASISSRYRNQLRSGVEALQHQIHSAACAVWLVAAFVGRPLDELLEQDYLRCAMRLLGRVICTSAGYYCGNEANE
jgi:hypothetical protein